MQAAYTPKSGARKARRGAAMVEMVIVLSVLMMLLFGMIDMGLIIKDSLALSHLAKNAARSYALGTDTATIASRARADAKALGLDPDKLVTIEFLPHDDEDELSQPPQSHVLHNMEVTLKYQHSTIAGRLVGLRDTVALKGAGVQIKE